MKNKIKQTCIYVYAYIYTGGEIFTVKMKTLCIRGSFHAGELQEGSSYSFLCVSGFFCNDQVLILYVVRENKIIKGSLGIFRVVWYISNARLDNSFRSL